MKITLNVNGHEYSYTECELISLLERFYEYESEKPRGPEEGKWFLVEPMNIDRYIFYTPRKDEQQEKLRQYIWEAFSEVDRDPEKYGRSFETLFPIEESTRMKFVDILKNRAAKIGADCNSDWVHQVLEWAQRIYNGETWDSLCKKIDAARNYRMVIWKNKKVAYVGGSEREGVAYSPTHVITTNYEGSDALCVGVVPHCVRYVKQVDE